MGVILGLGLYYLERVFGSQLQSEDFHQHCHQATCEIVFIDSCNSNKMNSRNL